MAAAGRSSGGGEGRGDDGRDPSALADTPAVQARRTAASTDVANAPEAASGADAAATTVPTTAALAVADTLDEPAPVYCTCRRPYDGRFMVMCDGCEEWFHGHCVRLSARQGRVLASSPDPWFCPQCTRTPGGERARRVGEASAALPMLAEGNAGELTVSLRCRNAQRCLAQARQRAPREDLPRPTEAHCRRPIRRSAGLHCAGARCCQCGSSRHGPPCRAPQALSRARLQKGRKAGRRLLQRGLQGGARHASAGRAGR